MSDDVIHVWTDGSALKNPRGAMGWAWFDDDGQSDCGGAKVGTNQIGELTAILMALRTHRHGNLVIVSDSQYGINVATVWSPRWEERGWIKPNGQPVKNLALVQAIRREMETHDGKVTMTWTRGHNGNRGNERCDELAHGYAVACDTGRKDMRMPPEGVKALEESTSVGGRGNRRKRRQPRRG
jgi:ribonuclease HI